MTDWEFVFDAILEHGQLNEVFQLIIELFLEVLTHEPFEVVLIHLEHVGGFSYDGGVHPVWLDFLREHDFFVPVLGYLAEFVGLDRLLFVELSNSLHAGIEFSGDVVALLFDLVYLDVSLFSEVVSVLDRRHQHLLAHVFLLFVEIDCSAQHDVDLRAFFSLRLHLVALVKLHELALRQHVVFQRVADGSCALFRRAFRYLLREKL